jgi:predicted dehydrogenase
VKPFHANRKLHTEPSSSEDAPGTNPNIYGSYTKLYHDAEVDIMYIGTPHAFHEQDCLDAIAAGKHVHCEKASTMDVNETRAALAAAKAKGVFIMEAMRTRFTPLLQSLQKKVFGHKIFSRGRSMRLVSIAALLRR